MLLIAVLLDLRNFIYFSVFFLINLEPVRGKCQTSRETHSTEREMKDHSQTEETLNNMEVKGSAAETLKCLNLTMGYFV